MWLRHLDETDLSVELVGVSGEIVSVTEWRVFG
jgi:hypothetical protein